MRITFVLPHAGMGGGIRVLAIYADRLQRRGHQVTVISVPRYEPDFSAKVRSLLRGRGWPKTKEPEPSYFHKVAVRHHVLETERPVTDADVPDADIVLATFWRTAGGVAALSPSKGAKAIFLQGYETSPGAEDADIDAAWRLPLAKIVLSRWMVDFARDRFDDPNVHLVLNSVDTDQFFAHVRGKQKVPTVGMLYSPLHLKGADIAFKAIERVRAEISNLHLLSFGIVRPRAHLPLPDNSEYHYRAPEEALRHIYEKCDVWLCASRREGFHLPPLEAMACRCPVVSTSIGGPLDIIDNGKNGYLVAVDDWQGLGDRLLEVLSFDEQRWRAMSDAAFATATRYTWDDATDALEKALSDIINGQRVVTT